MNRGWQCTCGYVHPQTHKVGHRCWGCGWRKDGWERPVDPDRKHEWTEAEVVVVVDPGEVEGLRVYLELQEGK